MGKGIKKISENVIADKRSLTLVTSSANKVTDTDAMPLGMLNVDYELRGVTLKVGKNDWVKLDANNALQDKSIKGNLIGDNQIAESHIQNNAITTSKIKNDAITTSKIANNAVTNPKIADGSINNPKIASGAVTTDKIGTGQVWESNIRDGAVTASKIANNAVINSKIQDKCITANKIQNNTITCNQICASAPASGKSDGRIGTNNLQDGLITTSKLANGCVTSAKLAANAVATANLQNQCVTKEKIADGAITTEKLADDSVTKEKIADGAITLDNLGPDIADIISRAVIHDGSNNVTGKNNSTQLNNIIASGDIYANRVYNVVYMDIAEGYVPGEDLEAGDIVAIHEDGKVYKATCIHDCIVGVVSNEFANCLGASKEELFEGSKVAVGMIGKIHVKVKGPARLGQRVSISSSDSGIGTANWMNHSNIGQVLETIDCDFDEVNMVLVQVRPM